MFRVIKKVNSLLTDITRQVSRLDGSGSAIAFNAGDAIYLGSRLKFNSAYFSVVAASLVECIDTISIYNGSNFVSVAESIDDTDGFTKSGLLEFTPSKLNGGWNKRDTDQINGLNQFTIYGLYWARITLKGSGSVEFDYIGHKFSDDLDLFAEYPSLNAPEYLQFFGGTSFEAQHIIAGEIIEDYLVKAGYIDGIEQVLTCDDLRRASVIKVAEIIYSNCGNEFVEKVNGLKKEFSERMASAFPVVDNNNNAIIDGNGRIKAGTLYR